MKKLLILPLILLTTALFAQKQPDTTKTVPIHYSELVKIQVLFQRSQMLYHKLDIPALKRDTLDGYLNDIYGFLNRRAESVYADTVKKIKEATGQQVKSRIDRQGSRATQ